MYCMQVATYRQMLGKNLNGTRGNSLDLSVIKEENFEGRKSIASKSCSLSLLLIKKADFSH